jgi:hypothetical protein
MRFRVRLALAFAVAAGHATAAETETHIVPGVRGNLGAWLVLGPYYAGAAASALDTAPGPIGREEELTPAAGQKRGLRVRHSLEPSSPERRESIAWKLATATSGQVDLAKEFDTTDGNQIAYAAGLLDVKTAGTFWLVLSADDGVRVMLDGLPVYSRPGRAAYREDNHLVKLTLSAGRHRIVLKLHQDNAGWAFHTRFLDADFERAKDLTLVLPGVDENIEHEKLESLVSLALDRRVKSNGYELVLRAKADEGLLASGASLFAELAGTGPGVAFQSYPGSLTRETPEILATLPTLSAPEAEAAPLSLSLRLGTKSVSRSLNFRTKTREALTEATRARAKLESAGAAAEPQVLSTLRLLESRLRARVSNGDLDFEAQEREAEELRLVAQTLLDDGDPYKTRTGPMRLAVPSPIDGLPSEFALYVPPSFDPSKTYPLIVALHGLNGRAMAMLRWFFGGDDEHHDQDWEERHIGTLPALNAFVVAPQAHGNAFYRWLGEDDVLRVMDWISSRYPIDQARVTVTGPSMGGIGTGSIAFHYPKRFAAAAPLCGYHSALIRGDVVGWKLAPWERFMAEARSNVEWAVNGAKIPLYIVHGTRDLPELNSGVLIDRYEQLRYSIKHEHPDLGHNVWQPTYEGLKGARWLLSYKQRETNAVRFRTSSARYAESGFVRITELQTPGAWGEVQAQELTSAGTQSYSATTSGIRELAITSSKKAVDADAGTLETHWTIDKTLLRFASDEPLVAHKEADGTWTKGAREVRGLAKRGTTLGPFRDIYHEALTFVIGAQDAHHTAVNTEVARFFARVKSGTEVSYPIVTDADPGAVLSQDRSLFLVGNAKTNRVLAQIEASLPIRIADGKVILGLKTFEGIEAGAAFTFPHPKFPNRMIAVVEGIEPEGTFRAMSLPDLSPDYLIYDQTLAPTQGQTVLGAGKSLAAGFFTNDWTLAAETTR